MTQELDRMEETLAHRAVSETANHPGEEVSQHRAARREEISGHMVKAREVLEELTPHDPLEWQNGHQWKMQSISSSANRGGAPA